MSGSRSKKRRGDQRGRPACLANANANAVIRSARTVLKVGLDDTVFPNRTVQVVVGLCRGSFAQTEVIGRLTKADLLSAAAPNRRLVLETTLRLHWLQSLSREERRIAVDTMLARDRQDTNKLLDYLRDAGHEADFDPTEMDAFELDDVTKGAIHQQATRLKEAVGSSEASPWSFYSMWLAETPLAHPSASLAGKHAPTFDDLHLSRGVPEVIDPDLEALRMLQIYIVVATAHLLTDEELPAEFARRMTTAFFAA